MTRLLPVLAAALVAAPLRAADEFPVRQQYWQVLPGITWVHVDHAGNPWFSRLGGDVAASYDQAFKHLSYEQVLLLGDARGRLWINARLDGARATRWFDGKKWHETGLVARRAFEGPDGRVFLTDGMNVHVFDGERWLKQPVFAGNRRGSDIRFAADAKGRVWLWSLDRDQAPGVWCFAGGAWTQYRVRDGLPFDDVVQLVPWNDDRFVLIRGGRAAPSFAVWSPSRPLNESERRILPDAAPTRLILRGTDLDGVHYLEADGLPADPKERWARRIVVLRPDGGARVLTRDEADRADRMPQGLYENRQRIYGRLGAEPAPAPCSPGEAMAIDRAGRIYFRWNHGVAVLWPEYEKPGDALRLRADPRAIRPLRGLDGSIWGLTYASVDRLLRWDGPDWTATPVRVAPHPPWANRAGPPWMGWASRMPVVLPGRGGSLLAVAIHDVYQDIDLAGLGERAGRADLIGLAREQIEKHGTDHWAEAWFYRDGDWIGPRPLLELLQSQRAELTRAAARPTPPSAWFDVQSDGKRPWAVFDHKAYAVASDGVRVWSLPGDPALHGEQYNLCPLADGRMLLGHSTRDGWRLTALTVANDQIVAADFPAPPLGDLSRHAAALTLYSARDGSLWAYLADGHGRPSSRIAEYRGGRWTARADLGQFILEDVDGSLWFLPGPDRSGTNSPDRGYRVVSGASTATFRWPAEYEFGELTPTRDGRLLAACGYWLVELGKADAALKRPIAAARILSRYAGAGPALQSKDGTYFVPAYTGK